MKNKIVEFLKNSEDLDAAAVMNLDQNIFLNSSFKKKLIKDKSRLIKLSDYKFYLSFNYGIIRFQYNENTNKLSIDFSDDIEKLSDLFNYLKSLNIHKIELYFNSSFNNCIQNSIRNDYIKELVRKDKFFNKKYEDLVVITYTEGK